LKAATSPAHLIQPLTLDCPLPPCFFFATHVIQTVESTTAAKFTLSSARQKARCKHAAYTTKPKLELLRDLERPPLAVLPPLLLPPRPHTAVSSVATEQMRP